MTNRVPIIIENGKLRPVAAGDYLIDGAGEYVGGHPNQAVLDTASTADGQLILADGSGRNLRTDTTTNGLVKLINGVPQAATAGTDYVSPTSSEALDNKTLNSPVIDGTISGTAILDEDDMVSDSDQHLATQQSIKAYNDSFHDQNLNVADDVAFNTVEIGAGSPGGVISQNDGAYSAHPTEALTYVHDVTGDEVSSSSVHTTNRGANQAFDGVGTQTYQSWNSVPTPDAIGEWLQYKFADGPRVIESYSFQIPNDGQGQATAPKDWRILGSNTGAFAGEETTIHTVVNEPTWAVNEKRTFTVDVLGAFQYIRFVCDTTFDYDEILIGAWELTGSPIQAITIGAPTQNDVTNQNVLAADGTWVPNNSGDQSVETTDDVTFNTLTTTSDLTVGGDLTINGNVTGTGFLDEDDLVSNSDTKVASQQSIKAYVDSGTVTMTNKTLTSPTVTDAVLNTSVSGTAILDEDNMASDSDTQLATQQSIKAYVDSGTTTLTNKSIDAATNTLSNIGLNEWEAGLLSTDGAFLDNSDAKVPSQKAVRTYVESVQAGLKWKKSVRAASTVNIVLASGAANGSVINGVTLATNDRILLKEQTTASENGVYVVQASGAPVRATDFDTGAEAVSAAMFVEEGSTLGDSAWLCVSDNPVTIGTSDVVFSQFFGVGNYTGGYGVTLNGRDFTIDTSETADLTTAQTLTNKTLTSPIVNSLTLNGTVGGDAFLDEDDLVSNSATKLASQQSIKAFVEGKTRPIGYNTVIYTDVVHQLSGAVVMEVTVPYSGYLTAITAASDTAFSAGKTLSLEPHVNGTGVTPTDLDITLDGTNTNDINADVAHGTTGFAVTKGDQIGILATTSGVDFVSRIELALTIKIDATE